MTRTPPLSALSIPAVTSRPVSLQWSGDGQVFFMTKGSVYILTPGPGLHSVPQDAHNSHVKWFSTMIDYNARNGHKWFDCSQEWSALALGSLDVGLRTLSCSPSNLTPDGGCVVAILSSNMDLTLWHTTKNSIKGEWIKLCDVTPSIVELVSKESEYSSVEQTLRSQITSLLWTSPAEFNIKSPSPYIDSSLVITGTRAGTLMFFRYANLALDHVTTIQVSDQWITHLALSPWSPGQAGEATCNLAYGLADGSVGLVKIVQILSSSASSSGFSRDYTIDVRVEDYQRIIFEPDNAGITALSWVLPNRNMVLARASPGVLSLWTEEGLGWSGVRTLRLCTQKISVGSSALHPVSGLHYIHQEDALLVCLFDGSIHIVHSVSQDPTLSEQVVQRPDELTSRGLSEILRSTFERTEKGAVSKRDMNRVSGLIPYDDFSVALWVQESAQPSDFDYKYDVLQESTIVAAQLCKPPTHDVLLCQLRTLITSSKASTGATPLHILRPIFLYLPELLPELYPRIVELVSEIADVPPKPVIAAWAGDAVTPDLRMDFRQSLKQHLFGCDVLLSIRLKFFVTLFCLTKTTDAEKREELEAVAQKLIQSTAHIVLEILCRHLLAVVSCLREVDIPFLMRIALQSSMPGVPPELRADTESLLNAISSSIPSFSRETSEKDSLEESCPACGGVITLDSGAESRCAQGHIWGRCSVTSFILSTPKLRTCGGCGRKAFSAPSRDANNGNWLPPAARSWVVEELLEAAPRCLFCGNNFGCFF
ncbi:transcription factor IIIC subunit delta N-term-domain-containing protein [Roridomyces roridus]|uniref:Transcription factor IIIC subunit delta N-term-domain-containing protein n=1 Tax=Roridomyces roridus TaxID=1738132 RepID=A0AAD7FH87_9AGAR|nr:transcription factor IIIC subunit delta N-term-domain-containing protein [Roridomyces roridus]